MMVNDGASCILELGSDEGCGTEYGFPHIFLQAKDVSDIPLC